MQASQRDELEKTAVNRTQGKLMDVDDLGTCPYFARYHCLPGFDPEAICDSGCWDEPQCVTCQPREGWPSQRVCPVRGDHMSSLTEAACVSCGAEDADDNELLTDDEGSTFCEGCWAP